MVEVPGGAKPAALAIIGSLHEKLSSDTPPRLRLRVRQPGTAAAQRLSGRRASYPPRPCSRSPSRSTGYERKENRYENGTVLLCLCAQWRDKTPGVPRSAHGKVNFSAPAQKTYDVKPDLSGVWEHLNSGATGYYLDGVDIPGNSRRRPPSSKTQPEPQPGVRVPAARFQRTRIPHRWATPVDCRIASGAGSRYRLDRVRLQWERKGSTSLGREVTASPQNGDVRANPRSTRDERLSPCAVLPRPTPDRRDTTPPRARPAQRVG